MTQIYNNNHLLKAAGVAIDYTEEQLNEWVKCKTDPIYFVETYVKIVNLDGGMIPFKLYDFQKEMVKNILGNRKTIIMTSRQSAKTTTSAACLLWFVLFNDYKTVAILAHKAAGSAEVLRRIKQMYENLPKWLQQGVKRWNEGDIALENGSSIFTAATTASAITGRSVNYLYVDEAAVIPNTLAEEFFASAYPTLSSGKTTQILLTSTPRGFNHFWKFWKDSENGLNDFVRIQVDWHQVPGRDEKWLADQRQMLGETKFQSEVMNSFIGSSFTLLDSNTLTRLAYEQPVYANGELDIFETPKEGHVYFMTVDCSKGVGEDYSIFHIIDVTTTPYRQVAKYRNNSISPQLFPNVIYRVAKEYNESFVLFEMNMGDQVVHILYNELEYENVVMVGRGRNGQVISAGFGGGPAHPGVTMDKKVKRIGCLALKDLVESGKLRVQDEDTIKEFSTFIQVKDSYEADDGYHDDLVMGLVTFGWATTNPFFKEINNVDLREEMHRNNIAAIEEELLPAGWFQDGMSKDSEQGFQFN